MYLPAKSATVADLAVYIKLLIKQLVVFCAINKWGNAYVCVVKMLIKSVWNGGFNFINKFYLLE